MIAAAEPALFVDLDGTLVKSDLLWESLASAARLSPLRALRGLFSITDGRAALKSALAQSSTIDAASLPYRQPLLDWLTAEAERGRRIYLATAADSRLAGNVADHLGLFVGVIASDGQHNRKGPAKLEAIRAATAGEAFDYCGNGPEDLPIFSAARQAVVVGAPPSVLRQAQSQGNVQRVFADRHDGASWWRALRPHQWLKNLLLFVPLLTAFKLTDSAALIEETVAIAAFCLAASAGYLANDLLDLQADRLHPRKRTRPLAAGDISIAGAVAVFAALLGGALLLAGFVGRGLVGWLLIYLVMTLLYSLHVKRVAVFDVAMLAGLYTVRVLAGGAAIDVEVSFWLLAFSAFVFFSLALIKRCGELVSMRDRHEQTIAGRAYSVTDLSVLQPLGLATSVAAVLVFALFVRTPEVAQRYGSPQWLWLTLTAMLLWLAWLWLQTARGEMHDDPIVFAVRSPTSIVLVIAMLVGFALAAWAH